MFISSPKKLSTFLKYLLSYVLVFTVLISAFFLILRRQLTEAYRSQRTERIQSQVNALCSHLDSEILFLTQIDYLILENPDIKLATYRSGGRYYRLTGNELIQYAQSSSLIDSIVYYSRHSDHIFSTASYVTWNENCFTLTSSSGKEIIFDPAPYLNNPAGQMIWLYDDYSEYLIYFPKHSGKEKYVFFYILDQRVIQSQIRGLLSEEVPAVALLDTQGNYVTGHGVEAFSDEIADMFPAQGTISLSDSYSLFLSDDLRSGFSIGAVVSEDYLARQVDRAFMRTFLSLLCLSIVGIALVYAAMLFTYRPLRRLVKNLGHEPGRHQNYLDLISENYSALSSQKAQLEATLAQYRESMNQYRQRRTYPNETLRKLSEHLDEKQLSDARDLVDALLSSSDTALDYFHSCIILDCLTVITNFMSQAHIEFDVYKDVFTEAVQQCRDIQHLPNSEPLRSLIHELLFIYETASTDRLLHTTPLRQMVENNFCDPNFSLSVIASAFHVSMSRMSILFKEEMGVGFTECIWQMRLEKAKQLLRETEMSLEEISFAVGYLAHSSFGRKFKQETGITPSQYRTEQASEKERNATLQ